MSWSGTELGGCFRSWRRYDWGRDWSSTGAKGAYSAKRLKPGEVGQR
ncbi:MAG: hypothetical protein ACE5Z5_10075 [Candidatus Bathyarchaeia archaeon]